MTSGLLNFQCNPNNYFLNQSTFIIWGHIWYTSFHKLQISKTAGQLGGSIYYSGAPRCVSSATLDKWYFNENQAWTKDATMKISCTNGRLTG